jgi:hypothetical protein
MSVHNETLKIGDETLDATVQKSVHHRYPHIPVWRLEVGGMLYAYWQKNMIDDSKYILRPDMPELYELVAKYPVKELYERE